MRLGIFHMGNVSLAARTFLRELKVEVVIPPPNSGTTLSLGTRYSPETACLPYKLILGNFLQDLEMGADTLIMVTSTNVACRMGYYARSMKGTLEDLGYKFEMIVPGDSERGLVNLMRFIKRRANNVSWLKLVSSFRFGLAKLSALDHLEQLVHRMRAVERTKGTVNRLFQEAQEAIDQAGTWASLKELEKEYAGRLTALPQDPQAQPLLVGVVGETYVLMDPFASRDLESELGKLGVEVRRRNFASRWLRPGVVSSGWKEEAHRAALPYLKRSVGGEGWESVGEKVLCSRDYDGMVHLLPFTCMPEIIAQNILPSVKEDIPVLTLICDEQTGKQGMLTRLEAFVDLLNRRRQRKKDESLSRC